MGRPKGSKNKKPYGPGWSRGLTKETSEIVKRRSENISKARIGRKFGVQSPEWLENRMCKLRGRKQSEQEKQKRRKPKPIGFGEKLSKLLMGHPPHSTEEGNRKLVQSAIKLWQNPEFVMKQMLSRDRRPNKPEIFILNILERFFPGQWKYTGDFSFMVGGKNPDFANINGQKKLIEHFGTYYHRGQNRQDRTNHFKKYGFNTLIIWEDELKNEAKIIGKIRSFADV
jgi:hypothetical protein